VKVVGSRVGILEFRDFKLHENGSITAWESFQVGTVKVFTSEFLNRLFDRENLSDGYPQGTTKSYFVEGVGKLNSISQQLPCLYTYYTHAG
jgi:hypothetical protein